jgi:antitoxin component YwqK of YwqJK toxin-antitoxin module
MNNIFIILGITFLLTISYTKETSQTVILCDQSNFLNANELTDLNGISIQYLDTKINKIKCYYKGNLYTGSVKICDNNVINKTFDFIDGEITGYVNRYRSDGTLRRKSLAVRGKLEGEEIEYYSNGRVCERGKNVNDKRNGTWEMFDENGNKMAIAIYVDGKVISCKGKCD